VKLDSGDEVLSSLPGKFRLKEYESTNPIAVGDWVDLDLLDDGSGRIKDIHERTNAVMREATHGRRGSQMIAANVDLAIVVQSLVQPEFKPGFTDRFLVTCEAYGITPLIIINKVDLAGKNATSYLNDTLELYRSIGYDILPCSVHNRELIEAVRDKIAGNTCVFVGPSGVGKSSILNVIDPAAGQSIGEISEWSKKGTHTTTYARLIPLIGGGSIVDTPGIREFGLFEIEPAEIDQCFPEFEPYRNECRYHNCLHLDEPECKVTEAYDSGIISASRYRSYINIVDSLRNPAR
jgi:ribosome biogenesis GTPase / thiamine phosphate phosphatase